MAPPPCARALSRLPEPSRGGDAECRTGTFAPSDYLEGGRDEEGEGFRVSLGGNPGEGAPCTSRLLAPVHGRSRELGQVGPMLTVFLTNRPVAE